MATTQNTYTGDGSTVLFSFTFPYIDQQDVYVSVDGVDLSLTTEYIFANDTTIQILSAPTVGQAVRIYRVTNSTDLQAIFFPGSAIRAQDLNDNFTQNLYVTQEAVFGSDAATSAAEAASQSAASAASDAAASAAAVATAQTAATDALAQSSAAQTAATAAQTSASDAQTAAATAQSEASSAIQAAQDAETVAQGAVTTADAAAVTAAGAVSTADSAVITANSSVSVANNASTAALNAESVAASAVASANTALTDAASAVSTAGTAVSTAQSAVSTANSAVSTAQSAVASASTAQSTANTALAAVTEVIPYTTVANVAAIPSSPSDEDGVRIEDATGIESFSPLAGLPAGFVGDSGIFVQIIWNASGNTWNYTSYGAIDPDDRYSAAFGALAVSGGTITGDLYVDGDLVSKGGNGNPGEITLNCEFNSHGVKLRGPDHSAGASYTITLPDSIPTGTATTLATNTDTSANIPSGSTAERPATAVAGMFRFNVENSKFEGYDGTDWGEIAGGSGDAFITIDAGNFNSGASLVTTTTELDGGSF